MPVSRYESNMQYRTHKCVYGVYSVRWLCMYVYTDVCVCMCALVMGFSQECLQGSESGVGALL